LNPSRFAAWRGFVPLADREAFARGPVLVFAPHPDDEVIGCGGMLAFHARRGDPVHVLQMTGGERGDPLGHVQAGGDDLLATRRRESLAAAQRLGVRESVDLGFRDGALAPDADVVARLAQEVRRVAPALAYAPSPLECHPDHLATCAAAAAALARVAPAVRLLLYEVNHPTLATLLVDVTPWIEVKREALAQFRSQLRYTDVVGKCLAGGYARTVNVDLPAVQYAEAFLEIAPARVPELFADLEALHRKFGAP